MQKTDFAFEVLIHDDASTDDTATIIREYEEKYPNIIKPIYQTENQFSKGIKINKTHQYPRAQGEYLAWCEGDDYWTDPLKLQKQVDFLDNHPEYSGCAAKAIYKYLNTGDEIGVPSIKESREFSLKEIVMLGGSVFATNSFVMRKTLMYEMPDCFSAKGFGDYQLFMYSAIVGKIWCIAEPMSVYNCGVAGSWTERVWSNKEKKKEHLNELLRMLNVVNNYYNNKYEDIFAEKILETEFQILLTDNDKAVKDKKYRRLYRKHKSLKFQMLVAEKLPFLKTIKRKIFG